MEYIDLAQVEVLTATVVFFIIQVLFPTTDSIDSNGIRGISAQSYPQAVMGRMVSGSCFSGPIHSIRDYSHFSIMIKTWSETQIGDMTKKPNIIILHSILLFSLLLLRSFFFIKNILQDVTLIILLKIFFNATKK